MANNMEFNPSEREPNKGVSGYLQNQMAKTAMNRFAYGNQEGYGFLDKSMTNAQALTKQIEEIEKALGGAEKVVDSMNKKQQQAYTEAKTNAKLLADTLKNIRDSGVLSQEELNSLIKDNEKVTRDSVKALQTLMNSTRRFK